MIRLAILLLALIGAVAGRRRSRCRPARSTRASARSCIIHARGGHRRWSTGLSNGRLVRRRASASKISRSVILSSWQVTPNKKADLLFLKPIDRLPSTNMTVVTNLRRYNFELIAVATATRRDADLRSCTSSIRTRNLAAAATAAVSEAPVSDADAARQLELRLQLSGAPRSRLPARVFDDGQFHLFSMASERRYTRRVRGSARRQGGAGQSHHPRPLPRRRAGRAAIRPAQRQRGDAGVQRRACGRTEPGAAAAHAPATTSPAGAAWLPRPRHRPRGR